MEQNKKMKNVHKKLNDPLNIQKKWLIKGDYEYWHYLCDKFDDRGWGCGYRTLQTIASWIRFQKIHFDESESASKIAEVPSIRNIQSKLVEIGDKPSEFHGSKEWIGSFEVCLVLDSLYDVPSKVLHVSQNCQLNDYFDKICDHFDKMGSPIMMGGDVDCSSKGIFGACTTTNGDQFLLIVDPHNYINLSDINKLIDEEWVLWKNLKDFNQNSFYNLCMPQIKARD